MKRLALSGVVLVVAIMVWINTGEKPTHESLTKTRIEQMKRLVQVLEGVTDAGSANAAVPKIKAIATAMQKTKQQRNDLGRATPEQETQLSQQFGEEIQGLSIELMGEMLRIQMDRELTEPLQQALAKLKESN